MRRICLVFLLATLLLPLSGCERREVSPPVASAPTSSGSIEASSAYLRFFGTPPSVAEGSCFALVGYYPLVGKPGKVVPFPLFMFNRENRMQVVVEQLLKWGEGWDMGGTARNPFPPGTELYSLTREDDLVRVELSPSVLGETGAQEKRLILAVLGHTLAQFEGVRRVMIVAGGKLLPFQAERGFIPDPEAVLPPGEPTVLSVVGVWEEGRQEPQEVSVFFDRPVTVQQVELSSDGRRLEGEYFRSVFDMAVVVRPQAVGEYREGMPVQVEWEVNDPLGRRGEGSKTFALRRLEHP